MAWYEKAAAQGMPEAMVNLGRVYYFGDYGIRQNYPEAAKWLSQAAAKGNAWAQNTLGVMNEIGLGVKRNRATAVELFRKAAEQGDAKAQSNLGRMYARGLGAERNLALAYQWLRLSVEQNEITAQKVLDEVQPEMTPEQIAEGERLARDFRNRTRQR